MQSKPLPIAYDHKDGCVVLGLNEKTLLRFDPSPEGMMKLARHLQGMAPLPQGQKAEAFEMPQATENTVKTVFTFPQPAAGSGLKSTVGQLSREQALSLADDLIADL